MLKEKIQKGDRSSEIVSVSAAAAPLTVPKSILARTIGNPLCFVPHCKRLRGGQDLACYMHRTRRTRYGTTQAQRKLRHSAAKPYIAATISHLRQAVRANDPDLQLVLSELDSVLRHCELVYLHDLGRTHLGSERKAKGMLANILKRWPHGYQAATAVLAVVLGTRLACKTEPGITQHPAFVRAMQCGFLYSLVNRNARVFHLSKHRPRLESHWITVQIDRIVEPFYRLIANATARERDILERMLKYKYTRSIHWEYLTSKGQNPYFPSRRRSDKGKSNPRLKQRDNNNKKEIDHHVSQER